MRSTVIFFIALCVCYVLRKFANKASNANDRVHAIVVLQKKAGLVFGSNLVYSGWEFSLQFDNQSVTTRNRMFISQRTCKNTGSTVLVCWVGSLC